ncbi:MerR family transcriptional regulator, partial [Bacillus sp. D-CC]
MRIGELSKETGVSERSLRHYEEKGLLPSKRLANGYRDFDESAIEKVELIQMYLQIGLNLEETVRILLHGLSYRCGSISRQRSILAVS